MYKTWKGAIIGLGVGIGFFILYLIGTRAIKFAFRILGLILEYPAEALSTIILSGMAIYLIFKLKNSNKFETKFKS